MIYKKIKKNVHKGMTLIETLIYVALFGLIFSSMIGYFMMISESNANSRLKLDVHKNMIFISEHINNSFDTFESIDLTNTTLDNDLGKIRLVKGASTIDYIIEGDRLKVVRDGVGTYVLANKFKAESFRVERVNSSTNAVVGARIKFTFSSLKKNTVKDTLESMYLFK